MAVLIFASAASAKDFEPGDLRVCNAKRCVPITDRGVLRAFSSFYWGNGKVEIVEAPRPGAPAFQLRFRDGSFAGLVGGVRLNRTLVYGLNCGRFRRGVWYRLPARAVLEVRRLGAPLRPLRVASGSLLRSC